MATNSIKSNPPKTMLTIAVGFMVIFLLTNLKWALITSIAIGFIGIISDKISSYLEILWFKLAWVLGLIIPKILLTVIFYLFLFPIALLSKLSKKDPLALKLQKGTLWKSHNREFDHAYFEKTW